MRMTGGARWPALVSDGRLVAQLGATTVVRGRAYQQQGRVGEVRTDGDGAFTASVRGSQSRIYTVEVWGELAAAGAGRTQPVWASSCTCPVGTGCKHAAALVITLRGIMLRQARPAPPPKPAWERALSSLVDTDGADLPGLALRFTLVEPESTPWSAGTPRLEVTPARLGARGRWVKTGATWRELTGVGRHAVRPEHRDIAVELRQVFEAAARTSQGYVFYDQHRPVDLSVTGPMLWPVLGRAAGAGLALIDGRDRPVLVQSAPLSAEVEVERPSSAGVEVRAALVDPDGVPVGASAEVTVPLGDPMHGVAFSGPGGVSLWPVPQAPPQALVPLLLHGRALEVPTEDENRFMGAYLPVLRRHARVRSGPGVDLPPDRPPRLHLWVEFTRGHVAELRWQVRYPLGASDRGVPLSGVHADPARDAAAERDLLERVLAVPALGEVSGLVSGSPPALAEAVTLVGMATARFTESVLPELQRCDAVDVELVGTAAEYGPAEEEPVLHLDVADRPGENDWFDLAMRVTVDGQTVPISALITALTRGDRHLLLDSGTYVDLSTPSLDQLRVLVQEARSLTDPDRGTLRVSLYQAALWEQLAALGIVESQSRRWREAVDRLLAATDAADGGRGADTAAPTPPAGLEATLRPYQAEGFGWLATLWEAGLGGVLADDMGLGKTVQALALLQRAVESGTAGGPALVVAPTSVVGTWAAEAARFTPGLRVATVTGTQRRRGGPALAELAAGADLVVTSYTLVRLDEDAYGALNWGAVILDEAQFVKNHRAKTYGAVRRLDRAVTLAITGTPLENSLMDLWSILSLTSPGLFPDPEAFSRDYRAAIEGEGDTRRLASLRRLIRPFVLRRTKEQVAADLPSKTEQVVYVPMAPGHRRAYDRHLHRERQRILGLLDDVDRNRVAVLAALTTLRQMAIDPSLVDPAAAGTASPAKIDALVEQLTELAREGHRALVFSQFTTFLGKVRRRLQAEGIGTVYLDGRTRDRASRIEEFRSGDATAFLISLKAGGFGLTLTEADYVFVLDPWWNPAAENQAIDRTHRIGQDKPVMVYRYVSQDSIEEKVRALQERKQSLFDRVVDDDAPLSTALGAADLRALLAG